MIEREDPVARLLGRIARGERAALERLYRDHHGRIHAFILQRIPDPLEAVEILNDVMLTLWQQAHRFAGRSRGMTWILGIAHHKCLDARRRHARGPQQTPLEESESPLPEDEADACQALAALDDAALLRYCLERLSEAHRMVIHLAFYQDLGYADIAAIEGCPEGTVKSRMLYAKRALKRCLQNLGD